MALDPLINIANGVGITLPLTPKVFWTTVGRSSCFLMAAYWTGKMEKLGAEPFPLRLQWIYNGNHFCWPIVGAVKGTAAAKSAAEALLEMNEEKELKKTVKEAVIEVFQEGLALQVMKEALKEAMKEKASSSS